MSDKRPITYEGKVIEKNCLECGHIFSILRRTGTGPRYCEGCRDIVVMRKRKLQNQKYSENRRIRKRSSGSSNARKRKLIPYAGYDGSKSAW